MTREEVIEELKKLANAVNKWNPYCAVKVDMIVSTLEAELKAKDARITELEAKLEPKTCDGCEYEGDKVGGFCYAFHTTCSREPTSDHFTPRKGE